MVCKKPPSRERRENIMYIGGVVMKASFLFVLWQATRLATCCEWPLLTVTSDSMEPTFHRGDLILLSNRGTPFRAGDIVVWRRRDKSMVVHRVIRVHEKPNGKLDLVTKGDNNADDDRILYTREGYKTSIGAAHVVGRVIAYIPSVGLVPILARDYMRELQALTLLVIVLMLIVP